MADEPNKEVELLEAADKAQEDAELQAQIEKLKAQQGPGAPPADVQDDPVPPEKPAEPVIAAEPEKPKEPEVVDHKAWARIRALEKELKETRQAQQPAPVKQEPAKQGPTYEDDPAEFLRQRTAALENELVQQRQQTAMQERINNIRTQEAEYERAHPDYKDAVAFLRQNEVEEWEQTGIAATNVRTLKAAVEAGRRGDPNYRQYAEHISSVAMRDDVREMAEQKGQDPDDVAAYLVARDTYIQARQQQLWAGADAQGKTVAEVAYDIARRRGYKPAEPKPATKETQLEQSREKVLQQQQISEAANSLSETNAGAPAERKVIRNRADVLNLADSDLDALIESGQYRQI